MIYCSECQDELDDVEKLRLHLSVEHLGWIPYQCFLCRHLFVPTELLLQKHYEQFHHGKPFKVLFNSHTKRSDDLEKLIQKSLANGQVNIHNSENEEEMDQSIPNEANENFIDTSVSTTNDQLSILFSGATENQVTADEDGPPTKKIRKSARRNNPLAYCNLCERQLDTPVRASQRHVWLIHVQKPILQCLFCDFALQFPFAYVLMNRHLATVHSFTDEPSTGFVNNRGKYIQEYDRFNRLCFASNRNGEYRGISLAASEALQTQDACQKCGKTLEQLSIRINHIYMHLKEDFGLPRYRCSINECQFSHHMKNGISNHVIGFHKQIPATGFRDLTEELIVQFGKCLEEVLFDSSTKQRDDLERLNQHDSHPKGQNAIECAEVEDETNLVEAAVNENESSIKLKKFSKVTVHATTCQGERSTKKSRRNEHDQLAYCDLCDRQLDTVVRHSQRHIWVTHVQKPILQCLSCDFAIHHPSAFKEMRLHLTRVHSFIGDPSTGFVNNRGRYSDEFDRFNRLCFVSNRNGEYRGKSASATKALQTQSACQKCGTVLEHLSAKIAHVYLHLNDDYSLPRYYCSIGECQFTHYRHGSIMTHVNAFHKRASNSGYRDLTEELTEQFEKCIREVFPMQG